MGVQPVTSMAYLIKWPVSVGGFSCNPGAKPSRWPMATQTTNQIYSEKDLHLCSYICSYSQYRCTQKQFQDF
ncbi:hypothetical protein GDO81_008064 [Engystomops pustulosus]|uniref:Uncharacterized protein n=1 Tax=Engystomops pustulosus TaxID=76066 RepID=A0AAV7CCQ2_ENGPU|nr:hypothetical protein GDO81_008064 [Engystomops pustulosus]